MYYELYIDIYFLINFIMDYFLLMVVKRILKCQTTHLRVLAGAVMGALLTCIITVIPIPYAIVKFILFHGFVNVVMIKTGLKIRGDRTLGKAIVILYAGSYLLGGIFGAFRQYIRPVSLFLVTAVISYSIALGIWDILQYLAKQSQYRCEVKLCKSGNEILVNAIVDTGNSLRDSATGKPVSILTPEAAKKLFLKEEINDVRYISYHSIGKKEGVMPLFTMDSMMIDMNEKKRVERPLVAVCSEEMSTDEYQMILNPDVL